MQTFCERFSNFSLGKMDYAHTIYKIKYCNVIFCIFSLGGIPSKFLQNVEGNLILAVDFYPLKLN